MNVSDLDDRFEIAEYRPDKDGRASVELVNGTVKVRVPCDFYTIAGVNADKIHVDGVATPTQLADLKTILVAVLLATNTAIETEHGWTKYVEPT